MSNELSNIDDEVYEEILNAYHSSRSEEDMSIEEYIKQQNHK